MTNPAYSLLLTIQNILNNEVDTVLTECSDSLPLCPDLVAVRSRLDDIYNLIANARPKYYGLFTCGANFAISLSNQIVPFDVSFGGSILPNADGSITLPANSTYLIDIDVNGTFSVANTASFYVYDCDTGTNLITVNSASESYSSGVDLAEIRISQIDVGATPRRIGVKVNQKQTSGTLTLTQYLTYIKVVEV